MRAWGLLALLAGAGAAKKAADVFSCGVLVHWTLTYGGHPFGDKPAQRTANILRGDAVGLPALGRLPEGRWSVRFEGRVGSVDMRAQTDLAPARRGPSSRDSEDL